MSLPDSSLHGAGDLAPQVGHGLLSTIIVMFNHCTAEGAIFHSGWI